MYYFSFFNGGYIYLTLVKCGVSSTKYGTLDQALAGKCLHGPREKKKKQHKTVVTESFSIFLLLAKRKLTNPTFLNPGE